VGADERARAELSAYLGEIARDERTPRLGLTMIARFAFDKGRWGSSESFAAVVIVDGLARQLGMPVPALLVKNEIDRSALAKLYLALTDVPPDRLRATARTLWAKLFGAPLAPLARAEP
jgi:hypothetical protein